ncbi:MAG: carboxypeptidase-like regulatory domain-containing protein [Chitinophagaceae bacterium]|nr:carboxypeptidase-like regulatory domain-containing protein [Chitinophagaceae bacterium]
MKEQLCISVPEPCHEDWNKMTPVEQGKHCAVCQKNVVDFTTQDDEEILNFFKNYNGSACGRFTKEQLNRPIEIIELKPASSFLKYAAGLLLPGLMIGSKVSGQQKKDVKKSVIKVEKAFASTTGLPTAAIEKGERAPALINAKDTFIAKNLPPEDISKFLQGRTAGMVVAQPRFIYYGIVVDEADGGPISNVTVSVKGTKIATITNPDGRFTLDMNNSNAVIVFSSVGYTIKEMELKQLAVDNPVIKMSRAVSGEVVVVAGMVVPSKRTIRKKISKKQIIVDTVKKICSLSQIKIYPNPVASGSIINLDFSNVAPGIYQIRMLNEAGQLMYSFQKQISSVKEAEQIHLNEKMIPGIYFVQVMDEKKKAVQSMKVIIQ